MLLSGDHFVVASISAVPAAISAGGAVVVAVVAAFASRARSRSYDDLLEDIESKVDDVVEKRLRWFKNDLVEILRRITKDD